MGATGQKTLHAKPPPCALVFWVLVRKRGERWGKKHRADPSKCQDGRTCSVRSVCFSPRSALHLSFPTGLRGDYKARQGCVWEGGWAVVTNVGKQTQVFRRSFQGWGLRYKGLLMAPGTLLPAGPLSSLKQPITLKGPSLSHQHYGPTPGPPAAFLVPSALPPHTCTDEETEAAKGYRDISNGYASVFSRFGLSAPSGPADLSLTHSFAFPLFSHLFTISPLRSCAPPAP